jgi:hypothetical protein
MVIAVVPFRGGGSGGGESHSGHLLVTVMVFCGRIDSKMKERFLKMYLFREWA